MSVLLFSMYMVEAVVKERRDECSSRLGLVNLDDVHSYQRFQHAEAIHDVLRNTRDVHQPYCCLV